MLERRGGGYSQKNWVELCDPLPKSLTLFMNIICDFLLTYLGPDQNFTNLLTVAAGTVALLQPLTPFAYHFERKGTPLL